MEPTWRRVVTGSLATFAVVVGLLAGRMSDGADPGLKQIPAVHATASPATSTTGSGSSASGWSASGSAAYSPGAPVSGGTGSGGTAGDGTGGIYDDDAEEYNGSGAGSSNPSGPGPAV